MADHETPGGTRGKLVKPSRFWSAKHDCGRPRKSFITSSSQMVTAWGGRTRDLAVGAPSPPPGHDDIVGDTDTGK